MVTETLVVQEGLEKKSVKKHASAIHSSAQLSLLQRKISNGLLFHAFDDLLEKPKHTITVGQLCKLIGYNGNNYSKIKEALKGLISTVVEWNVLDEASGEEDWSASALLASANIKGSVCTYSYSSHLKELLSSPAMYARINMYIQSRFHSTYGLALYENCVRYRKLPATRWFEVSVFRKLMGVDPSKYSTFQDLKKRVIQKAVDEVNTYSDIKVTPEFNCVGRRVDKIRFKIKNRPKKLSLASVMTEESEEQKSEFISDIVKSLHLSKKHALELLNQYGKDYLEEKIAIVKQSKVFKSRRDSSQIAAYFVSAVKNDFQKSKEIITANANAGDKKQVEVRDLFRDKSKAVLKRFNSLDQEKQREILKKFFEDIGQTYGELIDNSGIDDPLVADQFVLFVLSNKVKL